MVGPGASGPSEAGRIAPVEMESAMSEKKTPMTPEAASRIQSDADRTGENQDFKSRAQRAAERNSSKGEGEGGSEGPEVAEPQKK
jgi:hypothetical protein